MCSHVVTIHVTVGVVGAVFHSLGYMHGGWGGVLVFVPFAGDLPLHHSAILCSDWHSNETPCDFD